MSATLVVRHSVADYAGWRTVYEELETLRAQHGCTDRRVFSALGDANDLFVTHDFGTVADAESFAASPQLKEGMARAGVVGAPRIEIFTSV